MLTSDPTSDSSDTGGSGKCNDGPNSINNGWDSSSMNNTSENDNQMFQRPAGKEPQVEKINNSIQNIPDDAMKIDHVCVKLIKKILKQVHIRLGKKSSHLVCINL